MGGWGGGGEAGGQERYDGEVECRLEGGGRADGGVVLIGAELLYE